MLVDFLFRAYAQMELESIVLNLMARQSINLVLERWENEQWQMDLNLLLV